MSQRNLIYPPLNRRLSLTIVLVLLSIFFIFPVSEFSTTAANAACGQPTFSGVTSGNLWQPILHKSGSQFTDREDVGTGEYTPYKNQLDISDKGGSPFI